MMVLDVIMDKLIKLLIKLPSKIGDKIIMLLYSNKQGKSKQLRKYFADKYKISVEEYTYGGCFSKEFNQGGQVSVGRFCSIAKNVRYFGANHPMDSVSTSAYFYNKQFSGFEVVDVNRSSLEIGNDVWIGNGVIITCGCKIIGTGAVIGAGSVVTHNVPEYAVVVGNPAKILKYRNTSEINKMLIESKWWEKEIEELMPYYKYMSSPVIFLRQFYKGMKNGF